MKKLPLLSVLSTCALISSLLMADEPVVLKGCAAKKQALQVQMDQARKNYDSHKYAGLQLALDQVNAYCTEASLRRERERKVKITRDEVDDRQASLNAAIKKGNDEEISMRAADLVESHRELLSAQEELEQ